MGSVASLLDVSRRALNAQSQALRTVGDNIANVNTESYNRRKVILTSTQATGVDSLLTGSGVEVDRLVRLVDPFLDKEYRERISDRSAADIRQEYLLRAEKGLSITNEPGSIGFAMNEFFSSLEDLSNSPADLSLRTQVLQKGEALAQAISDSYNQVSTMQRETDKRIEDLVGEVNTLSTQIAAINLQIASGETNDQENLTLRDQRDQLIRDMSEIVPVQVIESGRQVSVSLPDGFALVNGGNTQTLEFSHSPSFAPVGGFPEGLDGNSLGFIVHDFDATAGESHVDFTTKLYNEGAGEIGGLLRLRGVQATTDTSSFDATGDLVEIGSRIEAITRDLLTRFNSTYIGDADENTTTPAVRNANSGGLDGTTPGVFGLFSFTGAADSDGDGVAENSDLNTIGLSNYSSRIVFNVSDEEKFAAALDLDATDGMTSFAPGDSSNLKRLIDLRDDRNDYTVGNFSAQDLTIDDLYANVVGYAGGISSTAQSNYQVFKTREDQVKELRSSVSGVNIDEELTNLINFQRAFQAAARLVRIGDEMMQQIIGLLG